MVASERQEIFRHPDRPNAIVELDAAVGYKSLQPSATSRSILIRARKWHNMQRVLRLYVRMKWYQLFWHCFNHLLVSLKKLQLIILIKCIMIRFSSTRPLKYSKSLQVKLERLNSSGFEMWSFPVSMERP